MNAKDFDFPRFSDWMAEREERARAFLEGCGPNVLLLEKAGCNYVTARTPRESLACQLDALTRQMELDGDCAPFLEPWFGVGVFANAFGAEYVWADNESPQTNYIVFNEEEADKLEPPDIDNAPVMNLVLDAADFFIEETRGEIPVSCTDTQSPIDTATLIWETSSFFAALYTAPEAVHKLLRMIADAVIAFTKKQTGHLGKNWARPGHIMPSVRGGPGFSISDDNIVMISPEHYAEFSAPYNAALAKEFDGLAAHSCGNFERQLPALMKTEGLMMVDGAFSPAMDPNPNLNYELWRDSLKDTGVILHARLHLDWPEVLPRLYHPGLRLAVSVPPPAPGEPPDKNRRLLEQTLAGITHQGS